MRRVLRFIRCVTRKPVPCGYSRDNGKCDCGAPVGFGDFGNGSCRRSGAPVVDEMSAAVQWDEVQPTFYPHHGRYKRSLFLRYPVYPAMER